MNYEGKLREIISTDERFILMTAENRASMRTLSKEMGDRFIDVGIAEQTMIGMAAGLALRGRIPIAHALATFLTLRAFEFIRTDVGISGLPVKIVGAFPGFLSEANGPTHQAIEDISILRGIPKMGIFCPADDQDLVIGLEHILNSDRPFYIRHSHLPAKIRHDTKFEIGQAETITDGSDVAILTFGVLLNEAKIAADILKTKGYSIRLLNMRTLKPVDETAILAAARETRLLVTLEDHFITGGLFSIVSEILTLQRAGASVMPIALQEKWFKPALLADVLKFEGFTGEQIAGRIEDRIKTNL